MCNSCNIGFENVLDLVEHVNVKHRQMKPSKKPVGKSKILVQNFNTRWQFMNDPPCFFANNLGSERVNPDFFVACNTPS